ncbi:hypothetical protein MCNF_19950 [Mycolicibacterium confluentis]|uniref:Uncharacterized protein n=1 Tax=Mycolicibacterium confluentis TaxID=28047 RepID=A0A7I7XVQ8_9MYCO|nr:hypothetical protein MCNF_19950 [Mycolicibacterium confluentis]
MGLSTRGIEYAQLSVPGGDAQLAQEETDTPLDIVANAPDHTDGLTRGVIEFPVLVTLSRDVRAGVAGKSLGVVGFRG